MPTARRLRVLRIMMNTIRIMSDGQLKLNRFTMHQILTGLFQNAQDNHKNESVDLLDRITNSNNFLSCLITSDESWIFNMPNSGMTQ